MIYYRYENLDQMFGLERDERGILPLDIFARNPQLAKKYGRQLICEIPPQVYPEKEAEVLQQLCALKQAGLTEVCCENLGAFALAKKAGLAARGGMFLNITNTTAFKEYENLGACGCTVSFETTMAKIKIIRHIVPLCAMVYGYLPLMRMRVCPVKGPEGCGKCNQKRSLTDRTGRKFKVLCKNRQEAWVLNTIPLYVGDKDLSGIDDYLFYYTIENKEDAKKIADMFKQKESFKVARTNGLYFRDLV